MDEVAESRFGAALKQLGELHKVSCKPELVSVLNKGAFAVAGLRQLIKASGAYVGLPWGRVRGSRRRSMPFGSSGCVLLSACWPSDC